MADGTLRIANRLTDKEVAFRLMPELAFLLKIARPATEWVMATWPDLFGLSEGSRSDLKAQAVETVAARVHEAAERIAARIAFGTVAAVESILFDPALDDAQKMALMNEGDGVRSWAHQPVPLPEGPEGASMLRGLVFVLEEAGRLCPGWEGFDELRKSLMGDGQRGAWNPGEGGRPSKAELVLVFAGAAQWKREAGRARASRPALARPVYVAAVIPATMGAQLELLDRHSLRDGKREVGRIDTGRGGGLAQMDAAAALSLVNKGVGLFGTVPGHRLIDTVIRLAWEMKEAGETDPRRVAWRGGWEAMAADIMPGQKDTGTLKALVAAGEGVVWAGGDGWSGGGLWLYSERRGSRKGPGEVALVLGDALLPGFVFTLEGDGPSMRQARQLVPVLSLEPPTEAVRDREAGAVWGMSRLFVLELVKRAAELVRHGGILLTDADWREMAQRAGVPSGVLVRVLDSWRAGESGRAPALVTLVDGDYRRGRWTLADAHRLERLFIEEAGERRALGAANGAKGAAMKSAEAVAARRKKGGGG